MDPSVSLQSTGDATVAGAFTVGLALVHLFAGRMPLGDPRTARRWLSAAGGASVAYVFVFLLPEVSEAALTVGRQRGDLLFAEQVVYLVALLGFVTFYGVDVFVTQRRGESVEDAPLVFRFHLAVFAVYSAVVGYLLFHQETASRVNLFLYAVAMALHFVVTDFGFRRHHGVEFDRVGRWVLVAATLAGGVVGVVTEISGIWLSMLTGFLAGAVVLNVIKEELPGADGGRFTAFAGGALGYTALLVVA